MIVDDHPVVREGLHGMLAAEDGFETVGEAASGGEALALAAVHRPDVVLMDLRMPGGDGVEATARLLERHPRCRVLILTTYDTDTDILRAVEAGAAGYLLKDAPRTELTAAIRSAARGETVLPPRVATRLVNGLREQREAPKLSAREVDVLRLAAAGRTNTEIGRELHISATTVKTHLVRTFQKLNVSDRTAAVTEAMRHGFLPPPR
nr:response regulator transcription factor [Nocardiopsis mwathae]